MAKAKENAPKPSDHNKVVTRSNAYPYYTIEYAFELTKKIYTQFGASAHNTRETIAKVLKMSPNYLVTPLSTATQYGLLEMKTKLGYNPTQLFVRYYKPESEEEKFQARLECLKSPKLYEALINSYKGDKVPSAAALATALFRRYNIAENASLRAAEIFIDNLKELNLLDGEYKLSDFEGTSNLKVDVDDNKSNGREGEASEDNNQSNSKVESHQIDTGELSLGIKLNDGRKAKLIYPENINDKDWDKIIRVIKAMKDFEEE